VKDVVLEISASTEARGGDEFEELTSVTLAPSAAHTPQSETLLDNGNGGGGDDEGAAIARHLRVTLRNGYDVFCAVYR